MIWNPTLSSPSWAESDAEGWGLAGCEDDGMWNRLALRSVSSVPVNF